MGDFIMKTPQCIHVIDDDPDVRDSLLMLLKAEDFDVRTYAAPSEFLESGAAVLGGCVLTDLRMPEMSGVDLLARMQRLDIALPVVVMTAYGDVATAVKAMKLGASEFIEKPFDDEDLLVCLRSALARGSQKRLQDRVDPEAATRLANLTKRENEVLAGIIEGKLNKTVAHELGISIRTVESHRARIMEKTGASSLSELVRVALTAGAARANG